MSGYNWRLASNCLHIFDLFLFLKNSKSIKLYKNNFEEIYKSKRDGYFDIYGSMIFYDENHNKLSLIDNINSFNINGHQIKIYNKKIIYIIYENKNMCLSIDNKNINKNYFNLDLQSNLSKKYLEDILTNNIKLSKYIDVIENEKIIISNLKKYFVSKKITFQVT